MTDVDYVPPLPPGRPMRARDAVVVILVAVLVLVLAKGDYVRTRGEQMKPGFGRGVVLAVGHPTGAVADALPLADLADDATSFLSDDEDPGGSGGFADETTLRRSRGIPPVSPESFDPVELGENRSRRPLKRLLVTGDSMIQPMDAILARRLLSDDVEVVREPHQGTAVTNSRFLNWGRLAAKQAKDEHPDAVVVMLGAADGFPIEVRGGEEVKCCGARYAALYAGRVRQLMASWRRGGRTHVYWLKIPQPKGSNEAKVTHMVNAALEIASVPWRESVHVLDLGEVLSPGDRFRSAMRIDGKDQIVRETDGLHLTEPGARLAADLVLEHLDRHHER